MQATPTMSRWWMNIVTGPDNLTVAIGRVLGLILFVNLLLLVPLVVVVVAVTQHIQFDQLVHALPVIGAYVVGVGATITGMIGFTNPTEPKP